MVKADLDVENLERLSGNYISNLLLTMFLDTQDEQPAILSASGIDIHLNGTSEENISCMENGGSQLSVEMEEVDIAFLNEAGFSLLGEYLLDRKHLLPSIFP